MSVYAKNQVLKFIKLPDFTYSFVYSLVYLAINGITISFNNS